MQASSATSPFMFPQQNETPWILWEKKTSVNVLSEKEQTDGRYVYHEKEVPRTEEETHPVSHVPVIQRKQYNAVLSRINQAAGNVGSFAAWQP